MSHIFFEVKKKLIKVFPILKDLQIYLYKFKPYASKFKSYYVNNGWNSSESRSGLGSSLKATENIRESLPLIFEKYKIKSMLDAPCGDFYWMKEVDLGQISYTGCDIVLELIEDIKEKYSDKQIKFLCKDIIKDRFEKYDLIMTRDCLFHLNFKMIIQAIKNLKNSGSIYFLTTNSYKLLENQEIRTVGSYRPINLQIPPFNFPEPIFRVDEPPFDREMALWKFDAIDIRFLK